MTSPRRRQSVVPGDDLAQSLHQLSLSSTMPSGTASGPGTVSGKARTPGKSPFKPAPASPLAHTSPATSTRRLSSAAQSPLTGTTASAATPSSGMSRASRSSTPALLRKASTSSLRGAADGPSPLKMPTRRSSSANLLGSSSSPGTPLRSPMLGAGHAPSPVSERATRPSPPTAASVASDFFKAELAAHHTGHRSAGNASVSSLPASTVVILQDNCYGHRFARPRTSRSNLSTIVERPERIQACAIGVSVAYVRLGDRHAGGASMPHPRLAPERLTSIPFRIHKTTRTVPLLSPAVTNVHGTRWMEELKIMCDTAEAKLAHTGKELQRPDMDRGPPDHAAPPARLHEGDLYLCAESQEALEGALGGVCEAVDLVLGPSTGTDSDMTAPKRAFVAIRPPGHHCSASWPSGFCWINNVHIGIMHAILQHGLTHAAIVDFDLHHGDGSQAIAWQHNARTVTASKNAAWWKKNSQIGYFSLHDINSFPCESGDEDKVKNASLCIDNAHGQTMWNVHLEPWKTEAEFWALYAGKYAVLLEKLRSFLRAQTDRLAALAAAASSVAQQIPPKAAIFISAGFDASEWETSSMQRHKVNVPTEFYARFTRDVLAIADEEGTSVYGRVISVLEGGYSDRALFSGVLSHLSGLAGGDAAEAATVARATMQYNTEPAFRSGLGYEMGHRMGAVPERDTQLQSPLSTCTPTPTPAYDPAWWSAAALDCIEAALAPPPPAAAAPKHAMLTTTYSSPTQSSQAKTITTPKSRRSMSGLSSYYSSSPSSRPPSPPPPPPPEVPWTVAFHELGKLLIPTDRTTKSCTSEDLSAEATRMRRDKHALLVGLQDGSGGPFTGAAFGSATAPATPNGPTRVSLRERKQVRPFGSTAVKEEEEERRHRRRTVGPGPMTSSAASTTGGGGRAVSGRGRAKQAGRRLSAAPTVVAEGGGADGHSDMDTAAPPVPAIPSVLSVPPPAPPSSSGSTQPASAMSTASGGFVATTSSATAGNASLSVRKPRPATAVGKRSQSPVKGTTKTPRTRKTVNIIGSGAGGPVMAQVNANAAASASANTSDDMDKLTSGMRKIKIHVVTAAQKEARERIKREQGEKLKQADESKTEQQQQHQQHMLAVPSPPASTITTDSDDQQHPRVLTPTSPEMTVAVPLTPLLGVQKTTKTVPPPTTPVAQITGPPVAATPSAAAPALEFDDGTVASAPAVFVPYQPEGPTPVAVKRQTHALQWLPPNEVEAEMPVQVVGVTSAAATTTPTPTVSPQPMKREELPVFTATSAIPFARQDTGVPREE